MQEKLSCVFQILQLIVDVVTVHECKAGVCFGGGLYIWVLRRRCSLRLQSMSQLILSCSSIIGADCLCLYLVVWVMSIYSIDSEGTTDVRVLFIKCRHQQAY